MFAYLSFTEYATNAEQIFTQLVSCSCNCVLSVVIIKTDDDDDDDDLHPT